MKQQSHMSFEGIQAQYDCFSVCKFRKKMKFFDEPIYLGKTVVELGNDA